MANRRSSGAFDVISRVHGLCSTRMGLVQGLLDDLGTVAIGTRAVKTAPPPRLKIVEPRNSGSAAVDSPAANPGGDRLAGRRRSSEDSGGAVTSNRQFVYDGLDIVEQRDGANVVTKRYYSDGWRDVAVGASYFYTKDHLGSIREVIDGGGNLVTRYNYDPYGRVTKISGTVDSDMLYTGHYRHAPSGLHLTLYRAYSSDLARWLSPDPIGEAGGVNLYGYVDNNPVNLWDPLGLFLWPWQSPTPVTGGTFSERQRMRDALRNVRRTDRGQELLNEIRRRGEPVTVNVTDDNEASAECPGRNVYVDPDFRPTVDTTAGPQIASTESIVGHEIGHAVTGTADEGPNRMNNVNQNENPIRDGIGEPRRTRY